MRRELPQILQLDIAGNPCRWLTYDEAAYYYAKDLIAWTAGSGDYTIYGGENARTGSTSSLTMNTIIAVRGQVSSRGLAKTPVLTNRILFRRDRHMCAYCGQQFSSEVLTRDHVIPRAQNGPDIWTNVVTSCGSCNRLKDDRTPEQARMMLLYVPYAPNRSEYLLLKNRNVLADQMEFLRNRIPTTSRIHSEEFEHYHKHKTHL